MPDTLSINQARRLALAAQGITGPPRRSRVSVPGRPGPPTPAGDATPAVPALAGAAALRRVLRNLGAIQIDSINVVARSHELLLAARAGAHDPATFERLVYRRRAGFEYWGHAASFLPIDIFRLFLPRMERLRVQTRGWWADLRRKHSDLYEPILDRIRHEGPLSASDFRDQTQPKRGPWWDWAPSKHVLEDLFDQGVLMVHDRVRFERRYDLTERVLPLGLDLSRPTAHEAAVQLTVLGARSLGVGTAADLADYFRLPSGHAKPALADALASGLLEQVEVQGWLKPAFMEPGTPLPRRVAHEPVLLSPFDSLIWFRDRAERLFDFHYRIEVYVPAAKRQHGYYTMPVLAGGRLVARVDPKHDRKAGALLLRGLVVEDGVAPSEAIGATAAAAWRLAVHLRASQVAIGDGMPAPVATSLAAALSAARPPEAGPDPAGDPGEAEEAAIGGAGLV
jgi:uncharacterized protein YcaQ